MFSWICSVVVKTSKENLNELFECEKTGATWNRWWVQGSAIDCVKYNNQIKKETHWEQLTAPKHPPALTLSRPNREEGLAVAKDLKGRRGNLNLHSLWASPTMTWSGSRGSVGSTVCRSLRGSERTRVSLSDDGATQRDSGWVSWRKTNWEQLPPTEPGVRLRLRGSHQLGGWTVDWTHLIMGLFHLWAKQNSQYTCLSSVFPSLPWQRHRTESKVPRQIHTGAPTYPAIYPKCLIATCWLIYSWGRENQPSANRS